MPTLKKGYVSEEYETFSGYELEGSVDELVTRLKEYEARAKEHIECLGFDKDKCSVYMSWEQAEYDDSYRLVMRISRPETGLEKQKRREKELQDQTRTAEYERRQYEALRKKFEGK
jgi:hypothetical protein